MLVEFRQRLRASIIHRLGLHQQITDLQDRILRLESRLSDRLDPVPDERTATAIREGIQRAEHLELRLFALQQLVTASPSAPPPGAREAVAKLSSPVVSVILPTYNRARFVGEAIASVQAQSFPDWELVVIDDGSHDATEDVVAPFLVDRRIRYIRQQNAGSSSARNRGLEETSAALVAYIDSDNTWYPDFLALAVHHLAAHPEIDFVYGALVTYLHNLRSSCILWEPFDRERLIAGNFIDTNVMMHRRELVARYGGWDPRLSRLNDWDFALRCTADKPACALNALAAFYRQVDDIRLSDTMNADHEQQIIQAKVSVAPVAERAAAVS